MDNLPADPCPACGATDWMIDYDEGPEGDEIAITRCAACNWPPGTPMTAHEHLAYEFARRQAQTWRVCSDRAIAVGKHQAAMLADIRAEVRG